MSENVREAIRDKVKAIHATPSPRERADYYRLMEAYTDDLIVLVREAMLSAEAVEELLESAEEDSVLVMALSARKQRGDKVANKAGRSMGREWTYAQLTAAGFAEKEQGE